MHVKHWIWTHPSAEEGPEDWKRQFSQFRDAGLHAAVVLRQRRGHRAMTDQHWPELKGALSRQAG